MTDVLTYGDGGTEASLMAAENFPGTGFHPLSFACTPIELLSNDGARTVVSHATGFFWRHRGKAFLVTNWHVLTGRNIFTGKTTSSTGYIPAEIRFFGFTFSKVGPHLQFTRPDVVYQLEEGVAEKLNDMAVTSVPYDICALPIPVELIFDRQEATSKHAEAGGASCYVNDHLEQGVISHVGDDCFILGYPLRSYGGLMPPIWKRGGIASEPLLGVSNRPIFFVDAATSDGMSGAPILRRVSTGWETQGNTIRETYRYGLIGIYGGRVKVANAELHGAGYGWYGSLISKVIEAYWPDLFDRRQE